MRLYELEINKVHAVTLKEIPVQYQRLPVLGQGATSLAIEKDSETVLVFTRDQMKARWLEHGLHLISNSTVVDPVSKSRIRGMTAVPMLMLEMPKLYPLDPENELKVIDELNTWEDVEYQARLDSKGFPVFHADYTSFINAVTREYKDKHSHNTIILPLLNFLEEYSTKNYVLDFDISQFKQTNDRKLVFLDPIIDRELQYLMRSHVNRRSGSTDSHTIRPHVR